MKLSKIFLSIMLIAFAIIVLTIIMPGTSAERKGEDANPPDDENDWYIDSTGNYIGNETEWTETIGGGGGGEPTIIEHDDAVKIECNIRIMNGGELTLFNTTINITDHVKSTIFIEEGGRLIIENNSYIKNGNGSFMGATEIEGDLIMRNSSIENIESIKIITVGNTLVLENSSFMMNGTFSLANRDILLNSVSFTSYESTALYLDNCTVELLNNYITTGSNVTEDAAFLIEESEVTGSLISVLSSSDFNDVIRLIQANLTLRNQSIVGSSRLGRAIYATDSNIKIFEPKRVRSKGEALMECYDSDIYIYNASLGYIGISQTVYAGGFMIEDSKLELENVNYYRAAGEVVDGENVDVILRNTNFWNISGDAFYIDSGTIYLENAGFYNIRGDAIHLNHVTGEIINCSIDEDDPWWNDDTPFPPSYAGYGYGIMGHGIFASDSQLTVSGTNISRAEKDFIHLRDSQVDIIDCTLKAAGTQETSKVHAIYMENSNGIIRDNNFSSAYRTGGFDLFGMYEVPTDITDFIENNAFHDGRIFQQQYTTAFRVLDQFGTPVQNVWVNLSDVNVSNPYLAETGVDGRIPNPFIVPVYDVFRYTEYNNETNETTEWFTNTSYNDHHLTIWKEYRDYDFNLSNEYTINISSQLIMDVILNVSTPELSVKTAGVYPLVLQGGEVQAAIILRNFGEKRVDNVNVSYHYALNETQDWIWFGSDIISVDGIFNGGDNYEFATDLPINAPLGVYHFRIIVDPENTIDERNETNNEYTIMTAFEVLTRPRIFIDNPEELEIVNGTYTISGYAEDDYENDIDGVDLWIDGTAFLVTDITKTAEFILWSFQWDTTTYDAAHGMDDYPNGPHNISVKCKNSNKPGFDVSDVYNVTAIVVNVPVVHLITPVIDEYINETQGVPLYKAEVDVEVFHDLQYVKLKVDDGPYTFMNLQGNTFSTMIDTSGLSDGYHTVSYYAKYGYGNLTGTVSVVVNSPAEETLPTIDFTYNLTEEGLSMRGTSSDDFKIEWVKVKLDERSWITVNDTGENFTTFDYFWERGKLTPDAHKLTVMAFDGADTIEKIKWVDVGLLYDLTITEIIMPTDATEGDWVNFTVVVKNLQPYDSPEVKLVVYIGTVMRTINGVTVFANSETNIDVQWRASSGNHTVSGEINPSQKNDETDPNNNAFTGDNLNVRERPIIEAEEESDSNVIAIAVVIMVVLGAAAVGGYIFSSKKKV